MVRFFTQMYPKIPVVKSSSLHKHPGCLTVIGGNIVPFTTLMRKKVTDNRSDSELVHEGIAVQKLGQGAPRKMDKKGKAGKAKDSPADN